jgi:ribose transport system permease protein
LIPHIFLTIANFQTIFSSQAVLLILTLGLLPALAAGEYDLSAAGVLGVSLVLVGWLNVVHGWPIVPTVAVALAAGLIVGLLNALFIVVVGIDSIVVTLGMGTLLAGVAIGINNLSVGGISPGLVNFASRQVFGLQLVFYYGLILTILMWYVFAYTPLGRYLYFVGAGRSVARLTGIRVDLIRVGSLVVASLVSAVSGVLLAGVLGSADPTTGPTFLLPAFAGAFLGSTTITPGRFNAWGSFIAVYFLVTGITGLELLGFSGWIEQVFYGGSLVAAVLFSRLAGMKRNTGRA